MKEKLMKLGLSEEQAKEAAKLYEGLSEENAALKRKTEELREKGKQAAAAHKAEIEALRTEKAIDEALLKAGAKNKKAARAMLDTEKLKIDENGNIGGLDEMIDALKESDGYMFEQAPKFTGIAPGESKDGLPGKSFDEMTYSEQMAYLARTAN